MSSGTIGDVEFDPYDPVTTADPYPVFARLRDEAPLYRNEKHGFTAVSRFDDCVTVLQDNTTFSSARGGILELIQAGVEFPSGVLIFEDAPLHTIHRKLLSRLFTPKRIASLEPAIREFCARVMDPLVGADSFDIIREVGAQVPMRAIGLLLGVPEDEQEEIRDRVDASLRTDGQGGKMNREDNLLNSDLMGRFVDQRMQHPTDDMMSLLVTTEFEDEHGTVRTLTRDEAILYVSVVIGAGNETTGRLTGWAAQLLARQPDVQAELARDFSLIPGAIEEVLRLEPPGPLVCRYVTRDTELRGETVPEGSIVMAIVAAANRDERRYPDPDRLDPRRQGVQHLTFGGGAHYCLGNALARLEGRVILEELLRRFPSWDVDLSTARLAPTNTVRGWENLTVTLS